MKKVNWKAPGPDGVHDYWIKMFVSVQERIEFYLQSCITCLDCTAIERQEQRKRSGQL